MFKCLNFTQANCVQYFKLSYFQDSVDNNDHDAEEDEMCFDARGCCYVCRGGGGGGGGGGKQMITNGAETTGQCECDVSDLYCAMASAYFVVLCEAGCV